MGDHSEGDPRSGFRQKSVPSEGILANSTTDLDQLLARLVDGDAMADDLAALGKLLDGNPEAQRRYVHYLDLHQELLARAESSVPTNSPVRGRGELLDDTNRSSVPRTKVAVLVALAACLLLALGLLIGRWTKPTPEDSDYAHQGEDIPSFVQPDEEADDGVAVLTRAVDVEWLGDDPPHAGGILSPGELKLAGGLIQVEFYNGVQLLVEGPADLEIQSVASVICREGRLRSLVPPNATGFSVLTPKFELVDLGTEFAVDVASDGRADVHVFDGEVELYLPDGKREPDHKQLLIGGDAIAWSPEGTQTASAAAPETFTSFDTIRRRERSATDQRFENWQEWNKTLRDDPRIVTRYEFEADGTTLIDSSVTNADGTIVGCQRTSGRWPEKQALEFKRPGDRVRIDVPGEFEALTMSAWVRVDALPPRRQALLLTDGYQVGRLHWQIGPEGELRIGSRVPLENRRRQTSYASPAVFVPRQVGVWNFVCSTYDRNTKTVAHWFNGKRVFTKPLEMDQPIRIGSAEIGNWGVPLKPERRAIRNFIGRMDEFTIWNVALKGEEIADIYNKFGRK